MERSDGRGPGQLRKLKIIRGYLPHAEGSVLFKMGNTEVICAATVLENQVPQFLRGSGRGWVTAEYGMLPRATHTRTDREAARGRVGGRTHEIQRLIGRSLRAVVDFKALPEATIKLDCDVIRADGGTRTAAITGAYIALVDALLWMFDQGKIGALPIRDNVAAVSVGLSGGVALLDLAYDEDCHADVDMNVVMTGSGGLIEVQGTAEGATFDRKQLTALLNLAQRGIKQLVRKQDSLVAKDIEARRAAAQATGS